MKDQLPYGTTFSVFWGWLLITGSILYRNCFNISSKFVHDVTYRSIKYVGVVFKPFEAF